MLDDDNTTATTGSTPLGSGAPTDGQAPPQPGDGPADGATAEQAAPAAKRPARKSAAKKTTTKRATTRRTAKSVAGAPADDAAEPAPADGPAAAETPAPVIAPAEVPAAPQAETAASQADAPAAVGGTPEDAPAPAKRAAKRAPAKKAPAKRTTRKVAAKRTSGPDPESPTEDVATAPATSEAPTEVATLAEVEAATPDDAEQAAPAAGATALLFKAPEATPAPTRRRRSRSAAAAPVEEPAEDPTDEPTGLTAPAPVDVPSAAPKGDESDAEDDTDDDATEDTEDTDEESSDTDDTDDTGGADDDEQGGGRRRRRRGGRRRRRSGGGGGTGTDGDAETDSDEDSDSPAEAAADAAGGNDATEEGSGAAGRGGRGRGGRGRGAGSGNGGGGGQRATEDRAEEDEDTAEEGTGSRRRRRRRRTGDDNGNGGNGGGDTPSDDPQNTVTRVRRPRNAEDEITALHGSTRLEAKKQRRREGREAGRRRAPIVSEAEFLARREAVDRVMVIRQHQDLTQIAVLEDKVLVEHYVARESQTSLIGNVYLGRVQNVLPSMEAAFIDIGKGRNAVLYAGEVNWDSLGAGNGPRKIEAVLKSGQPILVQVSKDPIGHKGARLTSQVSLPGRFLVYVPDGTTSGISRKLPDTERSRLKALLKDIVPDSAGVIVRTAAEGASEEELTLDVERLTARWADIESKVAKGNAPQLLYGEPDLTLKVVRDLFTEDFAKLVVAGDDAWDMVQSYVQHVAPDLEDRLERWTEDQDVFTAHRVDEQIAKGLDRKVWLPSGGSLVIDRTEAMTVVDVNTGKFTGSGGNLEETVTKNNLEAAEEVVRQLRLRDIGGIIVIDFIDMVLESNRDLVLRRLVECLGRDRTRHQVAEVTSLGLVQMTRKRIGTGLVESFSENCEACQGRGVVISSEPVEPRAGGDDEPRRGGGRRGRGRGGDTGDDHAHGNGNGAARPAPSPKDIAAMAKHDPKPVVVPAVAQDAAVVPDAVPTPSDVEAGDRPATPDEAPVMTSHEPPAEEVLTTEPAAPAAPVTPPPPAGPVLVTSTRRRVARRPAGPPAAVASEPVVPASDLQSADAGPADLEEPSAGGLGDEVAVDTMLGGDGDAGADPSAGTDTGNDTGTDTGGAEAPVKVTRRSRRRP